VSVAAEPIGSRPSGDRRKGRLFVLALMFSLLVGLFVLLVLLVDVALSGSGSVSQVVGNQPSGSPDRAGAQSSIVGTMWLMLLTALICLPLGIGAAIYLEEYADPARWWNRLVEVNIQNLAAVPSIVFGILGLAFIVRGLNVGKVVLAGALILSLLVLPTVIISAREAIRAVPSSIRQASMALGATKWQTIWRHVLPGAIPGIATGSILALSRAIGETAPLILVGALTFITFNPTGPTSDFTALPIQIFNWISRPQDAFREELAAGGILILLVLLLSMNAVAILLRNRYQKRW
jgi:phosphate transport system permease protein